MVYVRMLIHRTGERYDNREWPPYLGEIDLPQWEADDMIRYGTAEYVDAPVLDRGYDVLKAPDLDYESKLKLADGGIIEREDDNSDAVPLFLDNSTVVDSDDFDDDFESVEGDNEVGEVTTVVKRPSTVDNKAAWVEWAVSKGADREEAKAKTKNALMADY